MSAIELLALINVRERREAPLSKRYNSSLLSGLSSHLPCKEKRLASGNNADIYCIFQQVTGVYNH
jgi:hypothetical protein